MTSGVVERLARAKVNLYLHVGPVRDDGLHDLESLFVFAEVGDVIIAQGADALSLEIKGDFAQALAGEDPNDNLILKAARALQAETGLDAGAHIVLDKALPVAAGIGGGSADAAAALLALVELWGVKIEDARLQELAFTLGADVPACLSAAPVFVGGAGEDIRPGPRMPDLCICLVNPRVATPTGPIFRAFDAANSTPPAPAAWTQDLAHINGVKTMLAEARNDLQAPAIEFVPVINDVIALLEGTKGLLGARMSGSGATCFALYECVDDAQAAAHQAQKRGWWAAAAALSGGGL